MKMMSLYKLLYFVALITIPPTMAQVDFARNAASFAVDLYKNCLDGRGGENVILSPLSIQTAVGLAYMGAAGETAKEMAVGLRFGDGGRTDVAKNFQAIIEQYGNSPMLKIANKVYVKTGYEMKDEFKKISTDQFHSEAENLNFAENTKSAKTINGWVEDKTNNKIKDLIKPDMLNADTRMVLVNAIYFKGFWEHKFDPQATEKMDFWLNENDKVPVDMMTTKKHFKYGRFDDLDATALEMKYKDSDLSMLVILPNKKTGLSELEGKLQNFNLLDMTSNMYSEEVIVKFPKFKIEFEISLNDVLKKMGMGTMFSNAADFSNLLTSDEQLKVSDVVHKAFIEVNEEGAEAAAATVDLINRKSQKSGICEPNDASDFEKQKNQNDQQQQQQRKQQEQNQHQPGSGQQQQGSDQQQQQQPGDDDKNPGNKKPGSNWKKSEDEVKPGEDDKQSGEKKTPENGNAPRTADIGDVNSESSDVASPRPIDDQKAGKKEPVPEDKRPSPEVTKPEPGTQPTPWSEKPASNTKPASDGKKPRRDKKPEPSTKPAAGDKRPRPETKTSPGEKKPSSNRKKAAADKKPVPAVQKPRSNSKSAPIKTKPASDDNKPDKKRRSVTIREPGDNEPVSSVEPENKRHGTVTKSVIGGKTLRSNDEKLDTDKKPERSSTPIAWDKRPEPSAEDQEPGTANQSASEKREDELFDKRRVLDSRPGNENESRPASPELSIKDYPRTKDNKDAVPDIKPVPGEESPAPDEQNPWSGGKIPWWDISSVRGDKRPESDDNMPGPSTKPAPDDEKAETGSETSKEVLMPGPGKSLSRDLEKPDAEQRKR